MGSPTKNRFAFDSCPSSPCAFADLMPGGVPMSPPVVAIAVVEVDANAPASNMAIAPWTTPCTGLSTVPVGGAAEDARLFCLPPTVEDAMAREKETGVSQAKVGTDCRTSATMQVSK